jgi:hypothetical protein
MGIIFGYLCVDFIKRLMEELKNNVEKYLERGKPLFENLTHNPKLSSEDIPRAAKILDMAMRYYSDSLHFYEKGEYLNSLTALEYAEGWMDAGKSIGLLEER